MYKHHIFLIHSSVADVCLGRFLILAVLHNAALGCTYLFKLGFWLFFFFSDIYPGVGLLSHIAVLFLVFWKISILFSTVAEIIYIPTNTLQGFPYFMYLLTFVICVFSFPLWFVIRCWIQFFVLYLLPSWGRTGSRSKSWLWLMLVMCQVWY